MRAFFTPNRVHGTCPFPSHTNVPSHPHPPQPELSSITGSPLQNSPQPPPPPRPRLATLFQQCLMDPRLQSPPLAETSPAIARLPKAQRKDCMNLYGLFFAKFGLVFARWGLFFAECALFSPHGGV